MLTISPFFVIDDKYKTARVDIVNKIKWNANYSSLRQGIKHMELECSPRVKIDMIKQCMHKSQKSCPSTRVIR